MNKIEIDLTPKEEEFFEEGERNIMKVRIQLPTGEMIDNVNYRVELSLSKEAMLGLGINLIRAVYNDSSKVNFWHLYPSESDFSSQSLGIYLHSTSCQLLVSENDFGSLQDVLDSNQKS